MAKWSASHKNITLTGTADSTTDIADSTYPFAIQGGSSTQRVNVSEVYFGGLSTSSLVCIMAVGRDVQVGSGSLTSDTNLMTQALDPATAALAAPVVVFNKAATNKPRRSTTLGGLLTPSFNAFGGVVRWVAYPGEELVILGNTASFGEMSFTAFTGTGSSPQISAHVVYEPF